MGLSVLGKSRQLMLWQREREIDILWLHGQSACSASSMPSVPAILWETMQHGYNREQMRQDVHRTSAQQSVVI